MFIGAKITVKLTNSACPLKFPQKTPKNWSRE